MDRRSFSYLPILSPNLPSWLVKRALERWDDIRFPIAEIQTGTPQATAVALDVSA